VVYAAGMFAHRNTSTARLVAGVVVGMTALASACGGAASPIKQPATATEPNGAPPEQPAETPPPKEHLGTGSALGESIPPPAGHVQDAGPHQDHGHSPDAGPPPAAVPTPKPKK
jgi:hypothetical protein